MRELSFVKKLKFNFSGSITKRALIIGDADNDRHNELVCANLQGDLAIFKERNCNKFAYANELGMITACAVGDVINLKRNLVITMNMEGWLFMFDMSGTTKQSTKDDKAESDDSPCKSNCDRGDDDLKTDCESPKKLSVFYEQRMPANCKEILLADLDGDGQNELIIGLTDRVLRTYKWIDVGNRGKFVGLYKWEFADQIGSVSLNPSSHENCMDIIVAQPGGTYARLECFDKTPNINAASSSGSGGSQDENKKFFSTSAASSDQCPRPENDASGDENVKTEYINKLTPEYHQLAIAQMRNHHISTEVLGGIRNGKGNNSFTSIVIATLDGTLMLVNKDEILWSLQVDHQLFALAVIEQTKSRGDISTTLPQSESTCTIVPGPECTDESNVTHESNSPGNYNDSYMSQYFVVCAWNGKTYIVDEERNYLRFKLDEAVSSFTAGNYYFDGEHHSALVYATFNNQIVLYFDVISENIRPKFLLDEIVNSPQCNGLRVKLQLLLDKLALGKGETTEEKAKRFYNFIHSILYELYDEELSQ